MTLSPSKKSRRDTRAADRLRALAGCVALPLGFTAALGQLGCEAVPGAGAPNTLDATSHLAFPISSGPHALSATVTCTTCHGSGNSFTDFSCFQCHGHEQQPITDDLHHAVGTYAYQSSACYTCHATGARQAFDHAGITETCATCHDVGNDFAALPVSGFTHIAITTDCQSCHVTTTWLNATGGPTGLVYDPSKNWLVDAGLPTYTGATVSSVNETTESLPMEMNHATASVPGSALGSCSNCHAGGAAQGTHNGLFHVSIGATQPTSCSDCHVAGTASPTGFVGPAALVTRSPDSAEMKHDAVAWVAGAPGTQALVTQDCGVCHSPAGSPPQWTVAVDGSAPVKFHAPLAGTGQTQPSSCIDCHANTRPVPLLTAGTCPTSAACQNAVFHPPSTAVIFDHATAEALNDCAGCHAASAPGFTAWTGGTFHATLASPPTTCVPCHAAERPTSTAAWTIPGAQQAPFDFVPNAQGITHGEGLDCAVCHAAPAAGSGAAQTWANGKFVHGQGSADASTCVACHSTQRPDLVLGESQAAALLTDAMNGNRPFDHKVSGTGDCFGCHQATVNRKPASYANYFNPATQTLPGGDWQGGQSYPGPSLVGSLTQFITLTEIALQRTTTNNPNNLVSGESATSATLYNQMLHTSAQIPAELTPNPAVGPPGNNCWHCHQHDSTGAVTSPLNGQFHPSINTFTQNPDGTGPKAESQPTTGCKDCHSGMYPSGLVELSTASGLGAELQAMDHGALFANGPVTINGVMASSVKDLDCSACHLPTTTPGVKWTGGTFHKNIGSATPADCTVCHYPLMADGTAANLRSTPSYQMEHAFPGPLTFQQCSTCHQGALGQATQVPAASDFKPGVFHTSVSTQPGSCTTCHGSASGAGVISAPLASTQSSVSYTFQTASGQTASNAHQWMNHASPAVAVLDCAVCHAADALATGQGWSKSDQFHAHVAAKTLTSCDACHGLANGSSQPGANNNLPAGLVDSTAITTADSTTGVAGLHDRIDHSDANVTAQMACVVCHSQVGPAASAPVKGAEWAQASFHAKVTATAGCRNCHLNLAPTAVFTAHDHTALTSGSDKSDCTPCHTLPGTGTAAAPNWLGAVGTPTCLTAGGFTVPNPPDATTPTEPAFSNASCPLPHPTPASTACTACHASASGGKNAIGYNHLDGNGNLLTSGCNSCHEAGSNWVGTAWNGSLTSPGAGDTRPITIAVGDSNFGRDARCRGGACNTADRHFYGDDCSACHSAPKGVVGTQAGSAYASAWTFHHQPQDNCFSCYVCHGGSAGSCFND